MRLRFVVCEFWGFGGGFSRLGGSSTARRRVDGVPPAHFPSRTFLVRALNPRDVSLSGRVLQGRGAVLLEVRAELHHAAHGARMAPRGGLEGPRQAGQSCSRHSRHRCSSQSGKRLLRLETGPTCRKGVRRAVCRANPRPRLSWLGVPKRATTSLCARPDMAQTRLPTLEMPPSRQLGSAKADWRRLPMRLRGAEACQSILPYAARKHCE